MNQTASYALVNHSQNRGIEPMTDFYYIDRLSDLSEEAMNISIELQEEAQQLVWSMLEDVEQVIARSATTLTSQKMLLLEHCLRNYLLEIIHVMERTNRELAYILKGAGTEINDEVIVKKLLHFFKWYVHYEGVSQ